MGSAMPGQVGGGLTDQMFRSAGQNPGVAGMDLSQATINQAMPGAAGMGGQAGFMQQIPKLLQGLLGNQGGAVPAQPHSQGGPAMASPGGAPGGAHPGANAINQGLNVAGMIPGPQQPFIQVASQLAPFF